MYHLHREQFLQGDLESIWKFFSSPHNLEKITPKDMSFVVKTKLADEPIHVNLEIDYIVRPLLGIPLKWKTVITHVDPLTIFVDFQKKGPYKFWEHTHTFTATDGGVWMTDHVKYELPFGILGKIAHALFVKRKLQNIFNYRYRILEDKFNQKSTQL